MPGNWSMSAAANAVQAPILVLANISSARTGMDLANGQRALTRFSDFWPASPDELALLEE